MVFTYAKYKDFFSAAVKECRVRQLKDFADGRPAIYLRHDVDYSVEKAYALAQLEQQVGITSTYYFLTTGCYNILYEKYRNMIRSISDSGFEIGLHFDPAIYSDTNEHSLAIKMNTEKRIIEDLLGKPVVSVSLHRPAIYGKFSIFPDILNAYDSRIFPDYYYSDSNMNFRGKDLFQAITDARQHPVQILMHPIHYSENGAAYPELFKSLLDEHSYLVHDAMKDTKPYKQFCLKNIFPSIINEGSTLS